MVVNKPPETFRIPEEVADEISTAQRARASEQLTWSTIFDPNNAVVIGDEENEGTPEINPWKFAYNEIVDDLVRPSPSAPPMEESGNGCVLHAETGIPKGRASAPEIPLATATLVPVLSASVVPDGESGLQEQANSNYQGQTGSEQQPTPPRKRKRWGLVDLIFGVMLTLFGVGFAIMIDMVFLFTYISKWCCVKVSRALADNCCCCIPFGIFWMLSHFHYGLEVFSLMLSIATLEIVGGVGFIVCTILSLDYKVGLSVYRRIRRSGHLTRWAFRKPFQKWDPPPANLDFLDCPRGRGESNGSDEIR